MIISIRTVGEVWNPVTKELDYTASFSLAFKRKGRGEVKVSNVFVDIYNPQPDHTQLVFHHFYAALKRRFKLSDFRLFYVDEDNDQIPVDHNLEFVDAVKYASKNLPSKTIQLIVVVGESQIPEYDQQHSGEACVVVERVMPPISVENVFLSDQSAEERTSEERTAKRFRDFLEAHKKEIVAEVTKQVYLKFAKELGLKSLNSINDPANAGIHYRENRTNQLHKPNDGSNVNDPNADKLSIMRQRSNWRRRQKSPSPPPRQEPRLPQNEMLNIPLRPPVTMASEEYCQFPITNQSTSALKTTPPKDTPKNENLCLLKKSNILTSDQAESLAQLDSSNVENSENQQANDVQIEFANDNISILSNSSNMSDFVIEDGDLLEGAMANSPRLRHSSSSSSFEIVSEPSPEPPSFDLTEDSLPIDKTKNSTKNIAQSSEQEKKEDEILILPELDIRPGGTYSFDTSTVLDASEQTTPKEVEKPIGPSTHSKDSKNLKKNKVDMVENKEVGANGNSNGQSSTGLRGIHSQYLTYGRQTLYLAKIRAKMAKAGLGKSDYISNYDDAYGGFSIDEDDDGDVDNDNKDDDDDDDDDEEYRRLLKFTGSERPRPPNRYISGFLAAKKRKDDESSDSTSEGRRAEVKMEKTKRGNSRVVEIKHIGKTASPPNSGARIDHNVSKGLGDTKKTSGNTSTMTRQSHASSSSERQHETRSHSYGYPEFSTTYSRGLRTSSQFFHDDQRSERYDRYSNAMQILPEPLISGALQAASSAYVTARRVIEKIRSPLTDEQDDTKPPGSS